MKVFTNPIAQPKVVNSVDNPTLASDMSNLITLDKDEIRYKSLLTTDKLNYTNNKTIRSKLIPQIVLNSTSELENVSIAGQETIQNKFIFENTFDVTSSVIESINKYQTWYSHGATDQVIPKTLKKEDKSYIAALSHSAVSPSLFNEFYSVPLSDKHQAILNGENDITVNFETADGSTKIAKYSNTDPDITDCRTSRLCHLSDINSPLLGHAKYKMTDFMYCRDVGKISNNYLITLRKFAVPIGDNIKEDRYLGKEQTVSLMDELGKMVCWIGEENKLEDILKYSFQASWKEYNAEIDKKESKEDQPKLLNSIMNLGAPSNLKLFEQGFDTMDHNLLLGGQDAIIPLKSNGTYDMGLLDNYDKNKIYEPQDTIRQTHQYEGKLTFSHDINLEFNYQLKAFGNINPKAAFMDLLSSIQAVTYRRGKYWMGQNAVYGTQTNHAGWKQANDLINNGVDATFGVLGGLISGEAGLDSLWGFMSNALSGLSSSISDLASSAKEAVTNPDSKLYSGAKSAVKGIIKNYLGRPAKYAFNSLLSGSPTGLWHLTIGNPLNPIISIGNLILEDTTIQHYGPLGIDDFPTGLRVTVKLKHAMPRDTIAIEQMYTEGRRTLTMPTTANIDISKYQKLLGKGAAKIPSPFGNTNTEQNMINMATLS